MFLRRSVPWPPVDIHEKVYGDSPRGTPPAGGSNARGVGVVKYSDFGSIEGYISETVQDRRCKLVLITNRKSYMTFRLVPKTVTLNDLERRNGPYSALFHRIRQHSRRTA